MTTSPITNLTAPERETTVTVCDDSDHVLIWTAIRKHITRLRKSPAFTEVRTGYYGSTEWAEFTIPADQWNPATGAKRRSSLTPEQRAAAADRLRAARSAS
jgi:hypothetical protein